MASLLQDLRFAVRLLAKHPGFTAVATLTLALGIGATTSIFTVVNAVLLRPLPYPQPEQLVNFDIRGGDGNSYPLPDTDFLAWRDQNTSFTAVAMYDFGQGVALTGQGEPERIGAVGVTDRFFAVLGVPALVGRTFDAGDDRPGAGRKVVLSYAFWQRRFHGDPGLVGRTLLLDATPHVVVGVMPPTFTFSRPDIDLWRTLTIAPPFRRGPFYTTGVARLGPGVSLEHARASLGPVEAGIKQRYQGPGDWRYELTPLRDRIVGDVRRVLFLLFGAVGFLLLIATANVANLMLARAASRNREIALRGALGAARARVAMQLVTESVVLAILGGTAGLVIAAWGTRALVALAPDTLPRASEIHLSVPVFLFALAVSSISGLLFGLAPAMRASRLSLVDSLKESGRAASAGGQRRVQRALVVAEIALALMLSIGAGLMIRSVAALTRVSPGFAPAHLVTFGLYLPASRYDTREKVAAFYDELQARLRSTPGIESVGSTVSLPPSNNAMTDNFMVEGQVLPPNQSAPVAPLLFVDDDYFRTLGVPLVAGRFFEERDRIGSPDVVIINETLAKRYFPGGDAVGKRLKDGGPERPNNPWMAIVGVVGDVKYEGLDTPPEPTFYLSYRQSPQRRRYVVVRTADVAAAVPAIRSTVAALDSDLPLARVKTVDQLMAESVESPRFRTSLVSTFAGVGLLLAAVGLYGVVAYSVSERTRELGVRVALGATSGDVVRLVLGETLALTGAGIVVGVAGALATTRLMASLLFGITPTDTVTFAAIAGVLLVTALVASYVPVRRATHVDPMTALRAE